MYPSSAFSFCLVLFVCAECLVFLLHLDNGCLCIFLYNSTAAVGFLMVSSAVTMSAPFFLGQVIDTVYTNPSEDFTGSLTSLCTMLAGVFLCGGAANAARVYLMQISGELSTYGNYVFLSLLATGSGCCCGGSGLTI